MGGYVGRKRGMSPSLTPFRLSVIAISILSGMLYGSSTSTSPSQGEACSGHELEHDEARDELLELCNRADLIGEMEVLDKRYEQNSEGLIQTVFTFSTILPMKGSLSTIQEVRMPGGVVGGRGLHVPGMPNLEVGDRHVLFLSKKDEKQNWRIPVGLGKGSFKVAESGFRKVVRPAASFGANSEVQERDAFITRVLERVGS